MKNKNKKKRCVKPEKKNQGAVMLNWFNLSQKKKVLKLEFISNVSIRHTASSPKKGIYDCLKVCLITKTAKERNNHISF